VNLRLYKLKHQFLLSRPVVGYRQPHEPPEALDLGGDGLLLLGAGEGDERVDRDGDLFALHLALPVARDLAVDQEGWAECLSNTGSAFSMIEGLKRALRSL
jgi:hypothetical protein